jgi:hypothetical protein
LHLINQNLIFASILIKTAIPSNQITKIEFHYPNASDTLSMYYLPAKGIYGGTKWVACVGEGPFVSAYMNAWRYRIDGNNGQLILEGIKQVTHNGNGTTMIITDFNSDSVSEVRYLNLSHTGAISVMLLPITLMT